MTCFLYSLGAEIIQGSGTCEQLLLELEELRRQNERLQAKLIDGKRKEEALQSRDAQWRAIFSSLNAGALFLDSEGRITDCNTAFLQLLDYTEQKFKDRSLSFFLKSENDFIGFRNHIFPEVRQIGFWNGRRSFKKKDGTAAFFETTVGALTPTETGDPDFLVAIREQSDRQRIEEALRESEEKYRNVVDRANDVIVIIQDDAAIKYVNPRITEMLGYTPEEVTGTPITDYIHPDELEQVLSRYRRRIAGEHIPLRFETVLVHKDGQRQVHIETNGGLIHYKGCPADFVIIRDITDRKRAEEEMRKHSAQLEELEQLINHSPAVVFQWCLSPDWPVVFVSDNVRQFGYCQNDFYSGRLSYIDIIHPDDRARIYDEVILYMRQDVNEFVQQYRIMTADGAERYVDNHTWKRYDANGKITHYQGLILDKTQEEKAGEERRRLEIQLQHAQKMEAVGTLASGSAHDFNNILQVISGYIQLLLRKKERSQGSLKYLAEVDHAVERAAELVQRLLTFSRKVEPELRPLDVNRAVEGSMQILTRTIPKMIALDLDLADDLHLINGDSIQLEQILINLGSNAMDAMPQGGKITFRTENVTLDESFCHRYLETSPGNYVLLTVWDTGQGIEKERLAHIFDPFYTTKDIGRGTGLGLAMVYGIVKNHNGYITCDSRPGEGAAFHIYFPAINLQEALDGAQKLKYPRDVHGGDETILLVDDEADVQEIARVVLNERGYSILAANDGESALQIYDEKRDGIDLVILDLGMPGIGGLRCLEELIKLNPQVKVLIASGYLVDRQVKDALKSGARGFIGKPYRLSNLMMEVRRILDLRE